MIGETMMPDTDDLMDLQFEETDPNQEIDRAITAIMDEGNYDEAITCLEICYSQISGDTEIDTEKLAEFKQALDDVRDDLDAETLGAFDEILSRIERRMDLGE